MDRLSLTTTGTDRWILEKNPVLPGFFYFMALGLLYLCNILKSRNGDEAPLQNSIDRNYFFDVVFA